MYKVGIYSWSYLAMWAWMSFCLVRRVSLAILTPVCHCFAANT
jgi:hypothetical protein